MVKNSLSHKVAKGSFWQFASMVVIAITNLIGITLLVRLLDPNDFGVVAAIQVVTGVAAIFSNLGIASALIQRKEITENHIAVGFTSSLLFGLMIFVLLWCLAPFLSSIYKANINIWMVRCYALVFPIMGWSIVSSSLLDRNLDFKRIFFSDVLSALFGTSGLGILLAYLGLGPWALVWGAVSNAAVQSISLSIMAPHSRRLSLQKKEFRDLFSFGGNYTVLRLVNYFAGKADNFVVGRWMGVVALGLYDRAFQIMNIPGIYLGNIIDAVTFPTLAQIQDETAKLKTAWLQGIKLSSFVMMPLSIFLVVFTPEIANVLLGDKWTGLVIPLQILFVVITFRITSRVCDSLARAKGALRQNTVQKLIYLGLVIIGSFIGKEIGLVGVAIGVNIAVLCHYFLMARLAVNLIHGTVKEFLLAQKPGIVNALILLLICLPMSFILRLQNLSSFFILIFASTLIIIIVSLLVIFFPSLLDAEIRYWINIYLDILGFTRMGEKIMGDLVIKKSKRIL